MDKVNIKEDIFNKFFEKIGNDEEFPKEITNILREILKTGNLNSKDIILDSIKQGCKNVSRD